MSVIARFASAFGLCQPSADQRSQMLLDRAAARALFILPPIAARTEREVSNKQQMSDKGGSDRTTTLLDRCPLQAIGTQEHISQGCSYGGKLNLLLYLLVHCECEICRPNKQQSVAPTDRQVRMCLDCLFGETALFMRSCSGGLVWQNHKSAGNWRLIATRV